MAESEKKPNTGVQRDNSRKGEEKWRDPKAVREKELEEEETPCTDGWRLCASVNEDGHRAEDAKRQEDNRYPVLMRQEAVYGRLGRLRSGKEAGAGSGSSLILRLAASCT